jgi:hypothetical protein
MVVWTSGTDDDLIVRPLLHTADGFVVSSPAEIAASLRHWLILAAVEFGCVPELADAFRFTAARKVREILYWQGAVMESVDWDVDSSGALLARFLNSAGLTIDVAVMTDDLVDYSADKPFGVWPKPDLGHQLERALTSAADEPDGLWLRLAITDGVARQFFMGLSHSEERAPLLWLPLDELWTMTIVDGSDPLFLHRFAVASEDVHGRSRVMSFTPLDTYSLYRANHQSFYLSDDGPPAVLSVAPGSGVDVRLDAKRRAGVHQVLAPDGKRFIDVVALYPASRPIYFVHPRHAEDAWLVELDGTSFWVQIASNSIATELRDLLINVAEAVCFWLYELASRKEMDYSQSATPKRILIRVELDHPPRWSALLHNADLAINQAAPLVQMDRTDLDHVALTLRADGAARLLARSNKADRDIVATLKEAFPVVSSSSSDLLEILASDPNMRMLTAVGVDGVEMRPTQTVARHVVPAVTATLLDELGAHLGASGWEEGDIAAEDRTKVLNEAVAYYFKKLEACVRELSPEGLIDFLVMKDDALVAESAHERRMLPSRLACFGPESVVASELMESVSRNSESAVANRFLVEFVVAQPPRGAKLIDLDTYDRLLALAAEITSKGTVSDAIHFGLSDISMDILPSGRLGMSRDDRYSTAVRGLATAEAEAQIAVGTGRDDPIEGTHSPGELPMEAADQAVREEFGFSLTELAHAVGVLVELADQQPDAVAKLPRPQLSSRLAEELTWPESKVDALIHSLALEARSRFVTVPSDVYPWRHNRDLSYMRRPLLCVEENGEPVVHWSARRVWLAGYYWSSLVFSARLKAEGRALAAFMGSIRHQANRTFERRVFDELTALTGGPGGHSIRKIGKRRLLGLSGDDLGDIDALVIDRSRRIVVVAEAKDFELARTPAELANEMADLLKGDHSAVSRLVLRADWVQRNISIVLDHFGIPSGRGSWRIAPIVVTSRRLISPRLEDVSVEVMALDEMSVRWDRIARSRRR